MPKLDHLDHECGAAPAPEGADRLPRLQAGVHQAAVTVSVPVPPGLVGSASDLQAALQAALNGRPVRVWGTVLQTRVTSCSTPTSPRERALHRKGFATGGAL